MKGTDSNNGEGHQGHKLNCLAKHQDLDQGPAIEMIVNMSHGSGNTLPLF
jgi:hypothetical protein